MRAREVGRTFLKDCPLVSTRDQFARALGRTLRNSYGAGTVLREAVNASARELRALGMDDPQVLSLLGALVEDAGRSSGADRLNLMSGQPRWMPVRTRVLSWAQLELQPQLVAG